LGQDAKVEASEESARERVLAAQALAGSAEAFRGLVELYHRPILTFVGRMVGDRGLADDLAQDVFLRAWRHLGEYDPSRKFSSWLFKIAHNRTIDQLRRSKLRFTLPLGVDDDEEGIKDVAAPEEASSPLRQAEAAELQRLVQESLSGLRPSYREILLLRFEQDMQYDEIAGVLGVALGTVKVQLHRARKALARELQRRGIEPPAAFASSGDGPE
jgi:RNA polymerase sigma-70 factor (ECF subfamily)